jgi:hypothetical protein
MNRTKGILLLMVPLIFQPGILAQQTIPSQDINQQLLEAAEKGDKSAVESLLARGGDANVKAKDG